MIDPFLPEERIAMLVGPGILRAGDAAVAGLRAFAEAVGVSVLNTYGAKGLFAWDSPYHGGTVGLQERDWELAGLMGPDAVDVVITSGVDPAECVGLSPAGRRVVDVAPAALADEATAWAAVAGPREPVRPPIYAALAAVAGPLYADDSTPPNPAKAAAALAASLPEGGVVVAEAGRVGWWIGRTFPTRVEGSVCVPAVPFLAVAVDRALAMAGDGRPVWLVIDGASAPNSEPAKAVLSAAGVTVVEWIDGVTVDFSASELLEAVAGPVTAWPANPGAAHSGI